MSRIDAHKRLGFTATALMLAAALIAATALTPAAAASDRRAALLEPQLTLTPGAAVLLVGETDAIQAKLTSSGAPVAGAPVLFVVGAVVSPLTTDANGIATFSYAGSAAGVQAILACVDANGNAGCDLEETHATATALFVEHHEYALALAPSTATNPVGSSHALTALLTDNGAPVSGAAVRFAVTGAHAVSGSAATDGLGLTGFDYAGTVVGQDAIAACHDANADGTCNQGEAAAAATKYWTAPGPFALSLLPVRAAGNAGTLHSVTATLTAGGQPVSGAVVHFFVAGANPVLGDQTTSEGGSADLSWVGVNPGLDSITACYDANGNQNCDTGEAAATAAMLWTMAANRPPDCSAVAANPGSLWPANHKYRTVGLGGATDPDGDPVTLYVTGVTQDESPGGHGRGHGRSEADAQQGADPWKVSLRAERDGGGDGRVYRIAYTAADGRGGTCSGTAYVGVPHDRAHPVATDSGAVYDSFGR